MRSLLAICVTLLAGCSTSKPPLPEAIPAPKAVSLDTVGTQLDVIDSRVAAAVIVAREANTAGKPATVESELSVASSYLPKPSEGDLAYARQRTNSNPAEYEAQRKKAAEKQKAAEAAWVTLESQVAANKVAINARDARITELTNEVERVKKDKAAQMWTMAGIGCALLGAAATAFVGPKVGIPLFISGAAIGAFPFVIDSPYFNIIAGTTLAVAAGLGLWYLWDKVRDANKASDTPAISPDDEAPKV